MLQSIFKKNAGYITANYLIPQKFLKILPSPGRFPESWLDLKLLLIMQALSLEKPRVGLLASRANALAPSAPGRLGYNWAGR